MIRNLTYKTTAILFSQGDRSKESPIVKVPIDLLGKITSFFLPNNKTYEKKMSNKIKTLIADKTKKEKTTTEIKRTAGGESKKKFDNNDEPQIINFHDDTSVTSVRFFAKEHEQDKNKKADDLKKRSDDFKP